MVEVEYRIPMSELDVLVDERMDWQKLQIHHAISVNLLNFVDS